MKLIWKLSLAPNPSYHVNGYLHYKITEKITEKKIFKLRLYLIFLPYQNFYTSKNFELYKYETTNLHVYDQRRIFNI